MTNPRSVEFKFGIDAKVTVKANNLPGVVRDLYVNRHGNQQYGVEYSTNNGEIIHHYFSGSDLEERGD